MPTFNFSIIIPYKNSELHLEKTILSLINQELSFRANVQLILIDNGSTDNSPIISQYFQKLYPQNITLIKEKQLQKSKNQALKTAKGRYITFLNSEDYLSQEVLANVLDQFQDYPECNIVKIAFNEITTNQEIQEQLGQTVININETSNVPITLESLFIKQELLKNQEFDETNKDIDNLIILNNIITDNTQLNVAKGWYNHRINDDIIKSKDYYTNKIAVYEQLLSETNSKNNNYVQNLILKDLNQIFRVTPINLFEEESEKNDYINNLQKIAQQIDKEKILKQGFWNNNIKKFLIYLHDYTEQEIPYNNLQIYETFNKYYIKENEVKFTIIINTENSEEYLENSIKSILNQTLPFEENVQLILLENNNSKTIKISEHYQKIHPQNISILKEDSILKNKQKAIKQAKGTYISFMEGYDDYSHDVLENVLNGFLENIQYPIVKISLKEIGIEEQEIEQTIINLNSTTNINSVLKTLFIKQNILKKYPFDENPEDIDNLLVINDIIKENPEVCLVNGWYNHRTIKTLKNKEEYTNKINTYEKLLQNTNDQNNNFVQYLIIDDLDKLFTVSHMELFENNTEKQQYMESLQKIIQQIDKEKILTHKYADNRTKKFLSYIKEQANDETFSTNNLQTYEVINNIFLKESIVDYYQSGSFNFTIIIPYTNSESMIEKSITSLIDDQTLPFKQNTQLIFLNEKSTDNSTIIIKHYQNKYPNNILIIDESNINKAKNMALKYATGKYIMFLNGTDYISPHTLENVLEKFPENEEINIIKMPVKYIGLYHVKDPIIQEDEIVDLRENPNKTQSYESLFIKNRILKSGQFDETLTDQDNLQLLNSIILENPVIGIAKGQYYQRATYNNLKLQQEYCSDSSYYTNKIKTYKQLINDSKDTTGKINDYTQYFICKDMNDVLNNTHLHYFNTDSEKTEYLQEIKNIIQQLDEKIIISDKHTYTNIKKLLKSYAKNDEYEEDQLTVNSITEKENKLTIKGKYTSIRSDTLKINIIFNKGNITTSTPCKIIESKHSRFDQVTLIDEIEYTDTFEVTIPADNLINSTIKFETNENDSKHTPHIILKTYDDNTRNSLNINSQLLAYNNIKDIIMLKYDASMESEYYHNKTEYNYTFSIIMPVYNTERFLEEAINSVINQTINFEEKIQLILINDGSTDDSNKILQTYKEQYPDNIILIEKTHRGQASARDLGLKLANAKYVNFMDSDDYLELDTLEKVEEYFNQEFDKTDIVTIPMNYVDRLEKEHPLNYKYNQTRIVKLEEEPENPQFSISSSFIKTEILKNYEFDTSLVSSEDTLILNQVLLEKQTIGLLNNTHYNYRLRFSEDNLTESLTTNKKYYTHRLDHFHKYLITYSKKKCGQVPEFIQYMIASDLNKLLSIRELDVFDDKDEINELWHYLTESDDKYEILGYISDECITENNNIKQPLKSLMMYFKYRDYNLTVSKNGIVKLSIENYTIDTLNNHGLWFDIIEVRFNKLYLSGHFVSNFYPETISLKLIQENENGRKQAFDCEYFEYAPEDRSHLKALSFEWRYDYNFNVQVPLENVSIANFIFELNYNENGKTVKITPNIGFRVPSGLTEFNKYFVQESRIVFYQDKKIYMYPYSYKMMLKREFRTLQLICEDKQDGFIRIIFYRLLYMLLYPFMKNRRIWFINDRLDRADENGIHLFRYAYKQNDGIKKYYILDKHCDDYKRLKKEYGSSILAHNSFKHKLLYFFTEKRIASFLNESFFNPFWVDGNYDIRKIYCNLVTSPWYFLQHGVIYRDLTSHIKRYKYNLALIVTSSNRERQSFFDLDYGFPEDVVQILGLPRYDNLIKNNEIKKQILFTPTWRLQLEKDESLFLNSDYYQMLNDFLSNEELFNLLNEYGYKFIFKPHPQLIKHLPSFKMNENVIISTEESYQELIRDSALMISDVSSVISDFAYLKKPIIYYQKNNDHHFEPFFDYVTEGFGDVFKKEEDVVAKVKYYLDNNCEMEEKYKERVSNFFKYNDKNNCKRVYEWILKH